MLNDDGFDDAFAEVVEDHDLRRSQPTQGTQPTAYVATFEAVVHPGFDGVVRADDGV